LLILGFNFGIVLPVASPDGKHCYKDDHCLFHYFFSFMVE